MNGSEYPSLAVFLAQHRFDDSSSFDEVFCHEVDDSPQVGLKRGPNSQTDWEEWVEHATDAWREKCTITTDGQLAALPDKAIIRSETSSDGDPWTWERVSVDGADGWWTTGLDYPSEPDLPAQLIWHPGWAS